MTLATLWTVAHQAPLSMEFSRQEYWSGLPFPSPGDLPDPGIEPGSPALQADSLPTKLQGKVTYRSLSTSIPISIYSFPILFLPGNCKFFPYICDSGSIFVNIQVA